MSLDYIFIKAQHAVDALDDLEEDESFTVKDYQHLAEELFPGIAWDASGIALVSPQGMSVQVEPSAVSLTVRLHGSNVEPEFIFALAAYCVGRNVVVVDTQTSELVTAQGAIESAEQYKAWYLSTLQQVR
jgi:hypothetical protein